MMQQRNEQFRLLARRYTIVAGERSPSILASMSDTHCKAGIDVIEAALVGNYQPEHIFALSQALTM